MQPACHISCYISHISLAVPRRFSASLKNRGGTTDSNNQISWKTSAGGAVRVWHKVHGIMLLALRRSSPGGPETSCCAAFAALCPTRCCGVVAVLTDVFSPPGSPRANCDPSPRSARLLLAVPAPPGRQRDCAAVVEAQQRCHSPPRCCGAAAVALRLITGGMLRRHLLACCYPSSQLGRLSHQSGSISRPPPKFPVPPGTPLIHLL